MASQGFKWASLAVPGLDVAGQLGGAALGGKAQKQAAKMQMQSQDKAMAFAREQEAARRADWQQAMSAYNANRNALLQRYGISVPTGPMAGGNMAQPPVQQPMYGGGGYGGGTLRDILQRRTY